jgi:hypothetical protein
VSSPAFATGTRRAAAAALVAASALAASAAGLVRELRAWSPRPQSDVAALDAQVSALVAALPAGAREVGWWSPAHDEARFQGAQYGLAPRLLRRDGVGAAVLADADGAAAEAYGGQRGLRIAASAGRFHLLIPGTP